MRIVIQARLGSTRLPGKIMAPLQGCPLLWHVVRRLERANPSWQVVVATTDLASDDATAAWCRENGIACMRSAADDVLARYVAACADLAENDVLLRATADNGLYCPRRTAAIVAEHQRARADYTCIAGLSYVVPEVLRAGALRQMAALAHRAHCREHVTPYFRQAAHAFRVVQLPPDWHGLRPHSRLTIDTADDLRRMQALFDGCGKADPLFSLEQAYAWCEANLPREARRHPGPRHSAA